MLKFTALFSLLLGALYICREFSKFQNKRISEYEGFYSLLSYMRGEIGCFLSPVSEWCAHFSDEALERCGFLPALRECEDLYKAFLGSVDKMSLSCETKDDLIRFFTSFGKGYADEVMRLIDSFRQRLGENIDREREEIPRSQKLVRTLCVSFAIGASILLI